MTTSLPAKMPSPLATLGSWAGARVRLTWCRDCRRKVEFDSAEQAERYRAEMTLLDWKARLVCSSCDSCAVDMVITGETR
jgi:hypothetical protein